MYVLHAGASYDHMSPGPLSLGNGKGPFPQDHALTVENYNFKSKVKLAAQATLLSTCNGPKISHPANGGVKDPLAESYNRCYSLLAETKLPHSVKP
jgi:hypothetical protein